jgi:hypothetical protein
MGETQITSACIISIAVRGPYYVQPNSIMEIHLSQAQRLYKSTYLHGPKILEASPKIATEALEGISQLLISLVLTWDHMILGDNIDEIVHLHPFLPGCGYIPAVDNVVPPSVPGLSLKCDAVVLHVVSEWIELPANITLRNNEKLHK